MGRGVLLQVSVDFINLLGRLVVQYLSQFTQSLVCLRDKTLNVFDVAQVISLFFNGKFDIMTKPSEFVLRHGFVPR